MKAWGTYEALAVGIFQRSLLGQVEIGKFNITIAVN